MNPVLKPDQVSYILDDCNVRVLITTRQRWEQLKQHAEEREELRDVVLVDGTADELLAGDPVGRVVLHAYADGVVHRVTR